MSKDDNADLDHNENEYDKHRLAKMLLTAGAAWLAGRGVELAYEAIKTRRNRPDNETTTD